MRHTAAGELKTGAIPATAARTETIQAKGYTLPEIFQLGKMDRCDLLKVDIEGAEYDLFRKIPDELWKKIDRVVMEVHNNATQSETEIVQVFEEKDYTVQLRPDNPITSMLWAVRQTTPGRRPMMGPEEERAREQIRFCLPGTYYDTTSQLNDRGSHRQFAMRDGPYPEEVLLAPHPFFPQDTRAIDPPKVPT